MDKSKLFTNGVKSISFIEGMIHLEFFNYIPGTQKDGHEQPDSEICQEMIMNPQGFIRTFDAMQRLAKQLEDSGVIRKSANDNNSSQKEKNTEETTTVSSPNWTN